ncbi:hypothetical protein D3C76_1572370 [compost metagenome]
MDAPGFSSRSTMRKRSSGIRLSKRTKASCTGKLPGVSVYKFICSAAYTSFSTMVSSSWAMRRRLWMPICTMAMIRMMNTIILDSCPARLKGARS